MYNTDLISTYCPALINYSMKVYPLCVTLYFVLLLKSSDLYSHLMYVILVKVFCEFFDVLLLKRRAPILFSYNYQSLSIINKHLFTELRAFMVLVMLYFFWYCLSSVFSTSALLVACFLSWSGRRQIVFFLAISLNLSLRKKARQMTKNVMEVILDKVVCRASLNSAGFVPSAFMCPQIGLAPGLDCKRDLICLLNMHRNYIFLLKKALMKVYFFPWRDWNVTIPGQLCSQLS